MGLKVAAAALCGFLTLGVCAAPAAGGIVARTDYDVSQRWELPKFLGKDFYPKLIWWGLIDQNGPLTREYEVYRTCAFSCMSRRADGVKGPYQGPYSFSDFFVRLRPDTHGWLFGTNNLSRPILLNLMACGLSGSWRKSIRLRTARVLRRGAPRIRISTLIRRFSSSIASASAILSISGEPMQRR